MIIANANIENSLDAALRFEALLAAFDDRRSAVQEQLRALNGQKPLQFLGCAYRYLVSQGQAGSGGARFLAELVVNHDPLVGLLTDPRALGREEALLVVRAVTQVAPGLEGVLLHRYIDAEIREDALPGLFRVLELTSGVDLVGRTNMQLTRLLSSKNPRVRAKIVQLLVGSTGSAEAATRLLEDEDPRVQASVIESLWPQAESPNAQRVFRSHMTSAVVRVATNSLVGLVKAGDRGAWRQLEENLRGDDDALAKAAAWAMGFLGDQSFRGPLEEALRRGNLSIRGGVLSAMVRLNQKRLGPVESENGEREPASIPIEKVREGADAWNRWRRESALPMPSLENAELQGAMLVGSDFSFCSFLDANLRGARLNLCNFFGADLSGADFSEAHLEGCDLRGCETDHQTCFDEASFRGSTLYGLDLQGVATSGASFDDADIRAAKLDAPTCQQDIA